MAFSQVTGFQIGSIDFGPFGGLLYGTCQQILNQPDVLDNNIRSLMSQVLEKVSEVNPLITYLNNKVEVYQQLRKHDKVTVVGSMGNKLFFPEKLPNGVLQIEMDILFERPMEALKIPVVTDQSNDDEESYHPTAFLKVDNCDYTLPPGISFLHVTDIKGVMSDVNKKKFFITHPLNGKLYLNPVEYLLAIPAKSASESESIMGEGEVSTFDIPMLPTLFRTFKTKHESITLDGKKFQFYVLIDKVAGVKIPWPFEANKFSNRQRKWPPPELIENIIQDGCHLVLRSSSDELKGIHHLSKAEWKYTFSTSEQKIALQFSPSQTAIFLLIKQIKRLHMDLGLFKSGEPISGLTTYHLKSVFLQYSETVEHEKWESSPLECFTGFFGKLQNCLDEDLIPHYFIPEINILSSAWHYKSLTTEDMDYLEKNLPARFKLREIVRDILNHPGNYLDGHLLTAVDAKHIAESRKEATNTSDSSEERINFSRFNLHCRGYSLYGQTPPENFAILEDPEIIYSQSTPSFDVDMNEEKELMSTDQDQVQLGKRNIDECHSEVVNVERISMTEDVSHLSEDDHVSKKQKLYDDEDQQSQG